MASSSSNTAGAIPVFFSAIHQDRDAEFRRSAPPKRVIKEGRKETVMGCTNCGRLDGEGVTLKKCTGCTLVCYCSKECQKENWPHHKIHCSDTLGAGIQPLIKSITGNPMLSHYIQVCLCLEFHLHTLHLLSPADRNTVLRAPLFAHINVGIEPTQITDFMNLYTFTESESKDSELDHGQEEEEMEMEGMMQLHTLVSPWPGMPERVPTQTNLEIWKHARKAADEDDAEDRAVVLVQFVNDFKQAITCPMVVGEDALDSAMRAEPFTMCSALTGKTTKKPMTIATCFEYINTHIRSDKKDRLSLRAPMRSVDKELIRNAGRDVQLHAPQALRLKMQREHVYISHPISVFSDRAPAPAREAGAGAGAGPVLGEDRQIEENGTGHPELPPPPPPPQAGQGQGHEPPKMNRAERRRLQRELQKEQKRRK